VPKKRNKSIFHPNPIEVNIRGLRYKEEKWRVLTNLGYNTYVHGNVITKLPV
jgi:hypothetical protein